MGVIWWLSAQSDTPGPPLHHPLDWAAHLLTYLALGFCLGRATGSASAAWVLAAWFGAFDEVHQAFVPGREAGITDWWFDLLGGWLGGWLSRLGRGRPGQHSPHADDAPPPFEMDFGAPEGR